MFTIKENHDLNKYSPPCNRKKIKKVDEYEMRFKATTGFGVTTQVRFKARSVLKVLNVYSKNKTQMYIYLIYFVTI